MFASSFSWYAVVLLQCLNIRTCIRPYMHPCGTEVKLDFFYDMVLGAVVGISDRLLLSSFGTLFGYDGDMDGYSL